MRLAVGIGGIGGHGDVGFPKCGTDAFPRSAASERLHMQSAVCDISAAAMCQLWLFLAFGTRGDVQPVAVVAEELRRRTAGSVQPVLLTHSEHRAWLAREPFGELRVCEVATSPYGRAPAPKTCGEMAGEGKVEAADEESYQQRACWEAANHLHNTISPTDSRQAGISLIVFNLFALEAS
eukprot:366228-Chlamydomonas_euryale.AAC.9